MMIKIRNKKAAMTIATTSVVIIIIGIALLIGFLASNKKVTRTMSSFEDIATTHFATAPNAIIGNPINESTHYTSQEITFDASNSYDLNEEIIKYFWDLTGEDIISSTEKTLTHVYYEPGDYKVRLKVMNKEGAVGETELVLKIISANEKDESKYENNPLFLVSDNNWNDILKIIPLVAWNDNKRMRKYNFVVYDEGNDNNDIIKIMDNYSTNKAMSFNFNFGGDATHDITQFDNSEYLSYWKIYDRVVLIDPDNDIKNKTIAALFAAKINTPLIFINKDNLNEYTGQIQHKRVYIIDSLDKEVINDLGDRQEELKKEYTTDEIHDIIKDTFTSINSKALMVE